MDGRAGAGGAGQCDPRSRTKNKKPVYRAVQCENESDTIFFCRRAGKSAAGWETKIKVEKRKAQVECGGMGNWSSRKQTKCQVN